MTHKRIRPGADRPDRESESQNGNCPHDTPILMSDISVDALLAVCIEVDRQRGEAGKCFLFNRQQMEGYDVDVAGDQHLLWARILHVLDVEYERRKNHHELQRWELALEEEELTAWTTPPADIMDFPF
ncbi:hypothetical protein BH23CHL4_BH23CHL4_07960 [soil metagenome]